MNTFWILIMKTLGYMKVALLPLMILGTTMGSSIASQIPPTASPTLEESTSCRRENQEGGKKSLKRIRLEAVFWRLWLENLNRILEEWEKRISEEKSSPSTEPLERSTMRKQDNYSSMVSN